MSIMAAKEETYVRLAEISAKNHKARRATQWKVFAALWGSLIGLTFYLLDTGVMLPPATRMPGGSGGVFLFFVTVFLIILPMRRAFRTDRLWQNYYAAMAEGRSATPPARPGYFYGLKTGAGWAQILITLFLIQLATAFILILDKDRAARAAYEKTEAAASETPSKGK